MLTKLLNSPNKILLNIGWSVFDRLFRMVTSMFVGVWVARYLGPEQFGRLNYAQIFPGAFVAFASLGLTNVIITKLIQLKGSSQAELLGTGFALKLISGTLCYTLAISAAYFLHSDDGYLQLLIYILSTILIFQSFDVIDMFFQANVLAKKSVWAKTLAFILSASLKLYFLTIKASLVAFALTVVLDLLFGLLFLCWFYKLETGFSITHWRFSTALARELLKSSWPLIISDLLIFAYMKLDQFMIQQLVGSTELGMYSAAMRLSEAWYFLAGALTNSFYPSIASYWKINEEKFYELYQKLISRLAAISIVVALGISLSASTIAYIVYGSSYSGVGPILAIHVWTGVPIFLGVGCSNLYILKNIQKYTVFRSLTGALVNVALNYWLIPIYGAIGASFATFISQLFASVLFNAMTPLTRSIFRLQYKAVKNVLLLNFSSVR
ncbi:flippase [Spirosoma sordidisoli]|uniref:Flippase n=1 Tax=Spirosoma sordidisoli TaxID=2502893 RepID=A0A4Q2UR43_9BACT|nr:flippase [Spirosoma sordidisoli]RYC71472.1 flippase [Spirosoma sordidisoli]